MSHSPRKEVPALPRLVKADAQVCRFCGHEFVTTP